MRTSKIRPNETICPYCGVGCRVTAVMEGNKISRITAHDDSRPNFGKLCPKGAYLARVLDTPDRLAFPHLRMGRKDEFSRVSWDMAVAYIAWKLNDILQKYGPNAVAFYGSGQLDTEACYISGKLFKGYIGTNNTDSNSRLCMSSAVVGYRLSLGSDGPPTCYDDINDADLFLILGANMAENHPVLFQLIKQRCKKNPNARIVVVDPRRTPTADQAHIHIPLKPGSDIAFLSGVAKVLLERGRVDRPFILRHTTGFTEFEKYLHTLNLQELANRCDLHLGRFGEVAQLIGDSKGFLSFYAMGANQSTVGVWKNIAIINLHLLTGQIGKSGAGPFSLTGQPNAMGGREAGYLSHQLPGYRFVDNPQHRQEMEKIWKLPPGSISPQPGLTAIEIFESLEEGRLKALWIAATNPAASMPDLNLVQKALRRAELVVVQDIYHPTETTLYADVLLPAAQWGEKIGTSTNSERLVTRSQKLVDPPGEARPDWWIFCRVAKAMGFRNFDYPSAEAVWDEYRRATRGTLCDQWGMTNGRLRRISLQWPCPHPLHPGTPRRYTDHRFPTPNGRAHFLVPLHQPPVEELCSQYPLSLTTGRIASQWHTMTRTGKVPELIRMAPEPFVEIHPGDAHKYGLSEGEEVLLHSRRGSARVKVRITDRIKPGVLFATFHWNDLFGPDRAINDVTLRNFDPLSKQPELKHCAVRIEKISFKE